MGPAKQNNNISNLKCIQINLRHSQSASLHFYQLLLDLDVDVALVQEPYAKYNKFTNNTLEIPSVPNNYTVHHSLDEKHAYGALILVKRSLKATTLITFSSNECIVVNILNKLNNSNNPINLFSVYCRPSWELNKPLDLICKFSNLKNSIICMDSNAKSRLWNSNVTDKRGELLEEFIEKRNLNILNKPKNKLKHIPIRTGMVDVTLAGDDPKIINWKFLREDSLSDHPYIYFEIKLDIRLRHKFKKMVPKIKNINVNNFITKLEHEISLYDFELASSESPEKIEKIVENITQCVTLSAIESKVPNRLISKNKLDFWNQDLLTLRISLWKARDRWGKTKIKADEILYKTIKTKYQRVLRKKKKEAEQLFCSEDLNKDPFKNLKRLATPQNNNQFPELLMINGTPSTDTNSIMTELSNSFFPSPKPIGVKQQQYIDLFENYMANANELEPPPITHEELKKAIFSLKKKSSPGIDGITIELIQVAYNTLAEPLLKLFNACLNSGHYPAAWKAAKVTVLRKPGKEPNVYKTAKGHRPISVLNVKGKIFEKILHERMTWMAKQQKWFGYSQHGFKEGKSTETAMHALSKLVEENMQKKEFTTVLFLDISGAFDCAWPAAILAALAKRNCPVYILKLIKSLFENRTASMSNGDFTKIFNVLIGCPQGGILSPFLWIILAEELINFCFNFRFKIISYADDIALITMHKILKIAITNLQQMSDLVFQTCTDILLEINPLKSILMIFSKLMADEIVYININNVKVTPSTEAKFVGFELDPKLSWKRHLEEKCRDTQRIIHFLKYCLRKTWGINSNTLLTLYKSIVIPKLLYGCSIWCNIILKGSCKNKLKSIQRTMLKCITRSFNSVSTNSLLIISNLLPIDLKAFQISASRFLLLGPNEFSPSSSKAIESVFANCDLRLPVDRRSKYHSATHPPWNQKQLCFTAKTNCNSHLSPSSPNSVTIYTQTDSSQSGMGLGQVICTSNGIIKTVQQKLPNHTTREQAESFGILTALQYAKSANYESCAIVCSSKSAIRACTQDDKTTATNSYCRDFLYNADNISLLWVPVNKGETGSELAYKKAKSAARQLGSMQHDFPYALKLLEATIQSVLHEKWEEEWRQEKKSQITKLFFPSARDAVILQRSLINHRTTQILTGHCRLNYFQHRIQKATSPMCPCDAEVETVQHHLFNCKRYEVERRSMIETCHKLSLPFPPPLELFPRIKDLWRELLIFTKTTKRLDLMK